MFTHAYINRQLVRNAASPYSLALASYAVFLAAWLFPPDTYTSLLHEPDLLFLNPLAFGYFTACIIAFLVGVRASRFFCHTKTSTPQRLIGVSNALVYLLTPLAMSTAYCLWYLKELGARMPLLALLSSQQGQLIKLSVMTGQLETGRSAVGLPVLMGTLWWATFRESQINLRTNEKWFVRFMLLLSTVVCIATCVARVDRTSLVALCAGLVVVWLYRLSLRDDVRLGRLIMTGLICLSILPMIFVSVGYLRGAGTFQSILTSAAGYSLASYNRLTALLIGQMTYVYHGTGIYLAPYLLEGHNLDKIFHITKSLGWPTFNDIYLSEFQSVAAAGLNPAYIWSGAFGYIYSDLGWGTLAYLLVVGAVSGYAWARFKGGNVMAVVLYPWMMSCVVLWFAANYLVGFSLNGLFEGLIALILWDKLTLRRDKTTSRSTADFGDQLRTQHPEIGLALANGRIGAPASTARDSFQYSTRNSESH